MKTIALLVLINLAMTFSATGELAAQVRGAIGLPKPPAVAPKPVTPSPGMRPSTPSTFKPTPPQTFKPSPGQTFKPSPGPAFNPKPSPTPKPYQQIGGKPAPKPAPAPFAGPGNSGGNKVGRPSWQQSERDIKRVLENTGLKSGRSTEGQKTFGNSQLKGQSTKPDVFQRSLSNGKGYSYEVKNYNVETAKGRQSLVNTLSKQIPQRNAIQPAGTRNVVVIDVRGQKISSAEMSALKTQIAKKSGLNPADISFLRRAPVVK